MAPTVLFPIEPRRRASAMRFLDYWSQTLWPAISAKHEVLLGERPTKQSDGAVGCHYGGKIFEALEEKKTVRNITCNLAWTDAAANTVLQEDISVAMVENFVIDTFLDNSMHQAFDESDNASSAADDVELLTDESGLARAVTHRDVVAARKRVWRVPDVVPRLLGRSLTGQRLVGQR